MERITKLLVLSSLGAAIGLTVVVGSETRPELPWVFGTTFAAAFLLNWFWPAGIGWVLAGAYVVPAVVLLSSGEYPTEYHTIWTTALFGAMVWQSATRPWRLPPPWRAPLVGWALATALTWPVIVAREVDFRVAHLTSVVLPNSALGTPSLTTVLLILEAAITLLVGLVWLDWLFSTFSEEAERAFDRRIVVPLLGSCLAACMVAGYQLIRDITFVNPDFSGFGRAAGTMYDANAFGMVAALWSGAVAAWAADSGTPRPAVAIPAIALMWAGVWASGSRTSLVAAAVVFAWALYSWFRASHGVGTRYGRGVVAVGVAACLVVGLLIVSVTASQTVLGAARRLLWIVPAPSGPSVQEFIKSMWDREGYGVAAARMFRQSPMVGVGVGSFPILVSDYALSRFGGPLVPDNAQNWVRHQLVELGVLGSVGWLIWAWMFARFMLSAGAPPARVGRAGIIGGVLVAIAAVSQVGVPTQNVAVALTCWTLVFWYAVLRRASGDRAPSASSGPQWPGIKPGPQWPAIKQYIIMAGILLVYVLGTVHVATTTLRVPMRARQFGWHYNYGFYPPEPDGRGGEYQWTQKHAVVVVPAPTPFVRLTVWVNRHDIVANPVHARVWHDDHLVIDTVMHDLAPVTTYLRITGSQWLMLTTDVDRVVVPAHFGVADTRELGLAVEWSFLDQPFLSSLEDRERFRAVRFAYHAGGTERPRQRLSSRVIEPCQ